MTTDGTGGTKHVAMHMDTVERQLQLCRQDMADTLSMLTSASRTIEEYFICVFLVQ